jgi:hypothetical protein
LATKVVKTHGGGTPAKTVTPGLSAGGTSKTPVAKQKQSMMATSASTQRTTDQLVDDEKKGATDKEIQVDPTDADKKASYQYGARSQIITRAHHFSPDKSRCVCMADIRYVRDLQGGD